ncbi:MAG: thiamine/thiamine pyrophosphate ABC transporter permease ThiP [Paracoccaceae bacterium]
MAGGVEPVKARDVGHGARIAAGAVALAVGLPLLAVLVHAEGGGWPDAGDRAAIRFTLWQAAVSAAISAGLAVPVARALARRAFPGRGALLSLFGAPFILPSVVAAGAILSVFGRTGAVNEGLRAAGLPEVSVYGPQGVILAHVFTNLPLAIRLILQGWADIPAERFRLAESLNFTASDIARHLERPMLRAVLPGAFLAVFLVCLTSFAVALMLGGGPRATTVELAIYQAFRFDFDPGRAAGLAAVQLLLSGAVAMAALRIALPAGIGAGAGRRVAVRAPAGGWRAAGDVALVGGAAGFLLVPLVSVLAAGVPHLAGLPPSVWQAAGRSMLVALAATALALAAAVPMALGAARMASGAARRVEGLGMLAMVASPLVTGTGLFLILRPVADPQALALPMTAFANALAALPFALRILAMPAREAEAGYGRLADSLGMTGWARARAAVLPRLRRPLCFAAGLSAALSVGDLGVAALFGDPDRATLPVAVGRLMGAYRMDQAAGASLLLVGLGFGMFLLFDRLGGRDAGA